MTLHIEITPEQEESLRQLSERHHRSIEELLREWLQRMVEQDANADWESRKTRALKAVGRFRSGKRDVSEQHDAHLAEAYGD